MLSRARILQLAALPIFSAEQWRATRDRRAPLGGAALPVLAAGPFRVQEWRAGESLRLERHPFPPPGRAAGVDRLHLRFLASARSRALQVEHGMVDLALDLPPEEASRLHDGDSGVHTVRAGPAGIEALVWNLDDPRWGRLGLRRYLSERIDRARVRRALASPEDSVAFEWGEPCEGFFPMAADTSEAGAVSDTLWLRTEPLAPSLDLLYDRSDALRERVAVELALQLNRLGISCRLDPVSADVCGERIAARRFQAALVGWMIPPLTDLGEVYGSSGAFNLAGLEDPEVDRLIAEARGGATDTLPDAWQQIEARARRQLPYLFLFRRVRVDAVGPRVRAYRPDPLQPCSDLLSLQRN
jgi:ABC-type transport system substrate-binding protein